MKRRRIIIILVAVLVAAVVCGRLYARQAAINYVNKLFGAFEFVGQQGFTDTQGLREFYAEPDLAKYDKRVQYLSFLGGHYSERLSELRAGMIYCSEQLSLPQEQRFAKPPQLKYLVIESGDQSVRGVATAAGHLAIDCKGQILYFGFYRR